MVSTHEIAPMQASKNMMIYAICFIITFQD